MNRGVDTRIFIPPQVPLITLLCRYSLIKQKTTIYDGLLVEFSFSLTNWLGSDEKGANDLSRRIR
jgi:hypothetical protein